MRSALHCDAAVYSFDKTTVGLPAVFFGFLIFDLTSDKSTLA